MSDKIGILAGGGQFPHLFCQAAQKKGRQVYIAGHRGESAPDLEQLADGFCWVKLGQLGKILKFFKKEGVSEVVFLGTITKTRIFRDILPDLRGLTLWNKIDIKQDDAILRAIAAELDKEGIKVLASTSYLQNLLFPQGVLTRKKPNPDQVKDIRFGFRMAKAIGELDIGQCVVVRDQTVLAVEAIEGTDAAIRRGGALGHDKAVVVKVCKPDQDFRFDLPAIGLQTIESMKEVKAQVLAVEKGQSLLFDADQVIAAADKAGIVVVGVSRDEDGSISF
ncbi:MAG: UDP-2,3-diacylglucosamine diphosphatase LpxI [Desulfurivibrionaceae bacterium]|nr:UDP-2,3-diacylglucosamine diphosphatase LpxI [Desulfurivibrionaceae bacterium]